MMTLLSGWVGDDRHRGPMHIPAPKMPLPGHAESYRPPKEYLLTEEEQKQWEVRTGVALLC